MNLDPPLGVWLEEVLLTEELEEASYMEWGLEEDLKQKYSKIKARHQAYYQKVAYHQLEASAK